MQTLWHRKASAETRRQMKLMLSSLTPNAQQAQALAALAGKTPGDTRVAFISNGVDPYGQPTPPWALEERAAFTRLGFNVEVVDLRAFRGKLGELDTLLSAKDVLWFGGGNTFYLRWLLQDIGAEGLVVGLVERGKIYGGSSAGAIIAGPTLKHFETADDPHAAPKLVVGGLKLTQFVVVPHMDNEKYAGTVADINARLRADKFTTVPLNDGQALLINGDARVIL